MINVSESQKKTNTFAHVGSVTISYLRAPTPGGSGSPSRISTSVLPSLLVRIRRTLTNTAGRKDEFHGNHHHHHHGKTAQRPSDSVVPAPSERNPLHRIAWPRKNEGNTGNLRNLQHHHIRTTGSGPDTRKWHSALI